MSSSLNGKTIAVTAKGTLPSKLEVTLERNGKRVYAWSRTIAVRPGARA